MRRSELAVSEPRARALAESGYAVMDGFLDDRVLVPVRRGVELAMRTPNVPGCQRPHSRLLPLRWNDAVVDRILADRARRLALVRVTAGQDLRWISAYISVKDPGTPALGWHQDWWCWRHPVTFRPAAPQVALLVYLGDTSERNGALRVLPGSHRASVPLHALLPEAHATGAGVALDQPAFSDQPGQVTLSVRAGDAVVLDYRLLHGTHPNTSGLRRDCVLLSFTPCWAKLPADVRAHLVQHPALPRADEHPPMTGWRAELVPAFAGRRVDLELDRVPPRHFAVHGAALAGDPDGTRLEADAGPASSRIPSGENRLGASGSAALAVRERRPCGTA